MSPEEFKAKADAERRAKAMAHLNAEADRQDREALEAEAYIRLKREYPTRSYKDLCALAKARAEVEMLKRALPICCDCDEPTDYKHAALSDPWGNLTGDHICENCAERRYDRHMEKLVEVT